MVLGGTLNQQFFLSGMPGIFTFEITNVTIKNMAGGYDVVWKEHLGSTIANNDGRCIYNGGSFDPLDPFQEGFKECRKTINKIISPTPDNNIIRLGEMSWKTHSVFDVSGQLTPGVITFDFTIHFFDSDLEYKSGKMTKIVVQPSKFGLLERPDDIYFSVYDDTGVEVASHTNKVAKNIGIDPPDIHLSFVDRSLVSTDKGLGLVLTDQPKILDEIANVAIQGIIVLHKIFWELLLPGGSILVRVIELPETIDIILDIGVVTKKLQDAVERNDKQGVTKALMGLYKGIYSLGFKLSSYGVSSGSYAKQVDRAIEGELPRAAGDLGSIVVSEGLSRVADKLMAENLARISSIALQPTKPG
ncbi:hypothetical protein TWF173_002091, partial [Orbilia oligospora]